MDVQSLWPGLTNSAFNFFSVENVVEVEEGVEVLVKREGVINRPDDTRMASATPEIKL